MKLTTKSHYDNLVEHGVSNDKIACNDIIFTDEYNPNKTGLYVIGHEFGPICAIWGNNEGEALDNAVDLDLMDCMIIPEEEFQAMTEEEKDNCLCAGNADEPVYSDYLWIEKAILNHKQERIFAECRGAQVSFVSQF